jgi:hypothetical protein
LRDQARWLARQVDEALRPIVDVATALGTLFTPHT